MFDNLLVVCMGNICRSPLGEMLLKDAFPNKLVRSAGIASLKSNLVGKSADRMMKIVAENYQIDLSSHQAQQLTPELCQQADLILVMEKKHIKMIECILPGVRGKTMLYGQWIGKEIPDPYRQSQEAFEYVFDIMFKATETWKQRLK
ncbi:phosphotyrosine protein phosphatase [[Actinobacillus] muris]|uniref:protein-tyrosine-phosphatase n=1 Tax=Muribacter muris TaxID=67855 RepID=A0A0J5P9I8_9PAST|nr:phosphotyrosine protein phosphatase [Muribacter muris]KMK52204.1 phosphotyrosine protein phosphatase [[Actinobacillus] muris] [Muribacter muris]